MAGVEEFSDYEGGGVMPNTVFPKREEALTAADKLRLGYITGVETDSQSQIDPYTFYGTSILDAKPLPEAVRADKLARQQKARANAQSVSKRYRQTRRPNGYNTPKNPY